MKCPCCHEEKHVIKDGYLKSGKRRYKCKSCGIGFSRPKKVDNPKCPCCNGSTVKNGKVLRADGIEVQRYKCKNCRHIFIPEESKVGRIVKVENVQCYHCGSYNVKSRGIVRKNKNKHLYLCADCGKFFVENPNRTLLTPEEKTLIVSFCAHLNVSCASVATLLGKHKDTVRRVVRTYIKNLQNGGPLVVNETMRPEVDEAFPTLQFNLNERVYIYEKYIRKGYSNEQIAEEFNCNASVIAWIRKSFRKGSYYYLTRALKKKEYMNTYKNKNKAL